MEKLNGKGELAMRIGIYKIIFEDILGLCIKMACGGGGGTDFM